MKFIVEKTKTGYSAFFEDESEVIGSTGTDIDNLKENLLEAANLHFDYCNLPLISIDQIELVYESNE